MKVLVFPLSVCASEKKKILLNIFHLCCKQVEEKNLQVDRGGVLCYNLCILYQIKCNPLSEIKQEQELLIYGLFTNHSLNKPTFQVQETDGM